MEIQTKDPTPLVCVNVPLVNEYGSGYGVHHMIFCTHPSDAEKFIADNLDGEDGTPYWEGRGVWDQETVTVVSYYDDAGNASREPWWQLLELFAKKDIGPSALKDIARMSQWWPR